MQQHKADRLPPNSFEVENIDIYIQVIEPIPVTMGHNRIAERVALGTSQGVSISCVKNISLMTLTDTSTISPLYFTVLSIRQSR